MTLNSTQAQRLIVACLVLMLTKLAGCDSKPEASINLSVGSGGMRSVSSTGHPVQGTQFGQYSDDTFFKVFRDTDGNITAVLYWKVRLQDSGNRFESDVVIACDTSITLAFDPRNKAELKPSGGKPGTDSTDLPAGNHTIKVTGWTFSDSRSDSEHK